jgi:hypothetical protein
VAISHYLRKRKGSSDNVIEEMADTQLMLNQLKLYFGEEFFNKMMDLKSNKIENKLKKYN